VAFYENDTAPLAVMLSDVVTGVNCAESGFVLQVEVGGVFGKIPDWMAQIAAVSVEPINASSRAAAMSRPRVSRWT
jgi:hypothetical protein